MIPLLSFLYQLILIQAIRSVRVTPALHFATKFINKLQNISIPKHVTELNWKFSEWIIIDKQNRQLERSSYFFFCLHDTGIVLIRKVSGQYLLSLHVVTCSMTCHY